MLLSCPNCHTEYDVPDAALTGRSRKLRCANCMTSWKAPALEMYREPEPEPETALPEPELPEPDAERDAAMAEDDGETVVIAGDAAIAGIGGQADATPEPPERMSIWKQSQEPAVAPAPSSRRGILVSTIIVVVIIAAVLLAHRPIGHAWPPSLRLFHALGLR